MLRIQRAMRRQPDEHDKRLEELEQENAALREEAAWLRAEREAVRERMEQYRRLFESLPVSVYVVDSDGIITDVNLFHVSHMGHGKTRREDYIGKPFATRPSIVASGLADELQRVLSGSLLVLDGVHFPLLSGGGDGYVNIRGVPLRQGSRIIGAIFISEDVTMLKKAQAELLLHKERLEELVRARTAELSDALARVKTLSGFLPICASCKKVRDDKGYWTQVEAYLREHSQIEFSHGLCPDCMKKLYPDVKIPEE